MFDKDWFEDFFSGVALDLWREACPPEVTLEELDFLEDVLRPPQGGALLDVPCGLGRHSVGFAARGYQLTGVDLSPDSLKEARAEVSARGLKVDLVQSDMRAITWEEQFDGAYCLGNSIGYFGRQGMKHFASAFARALKPGARCVIDTGMAAESLLPAVDERNWYQTGEVLMLVENSYEAAESRLDSKLSFIKGGKTETRSVSHFVFAAGEIKSILEESGLRVSDLFSSTEKEPFELGSHRLIVVAEKRT
jgi:SAM-dependent methyltransferase